MCRCAEGSAPALTRLGVLLVGSLVLIGATGAAAQPTEAPEPAADSADDDDDVIIVIGLRGSAIKNIAPLATLDEDAIAATGAATMSELLKAVGPVTKAADGSEPIFLLNGHRIASYQEVGTLPPEAIEKMEVLPEPEALRFGYPPTRRVLNFITKRQFQQTEVLYRRTARRAVEA